MKKYLSFVLLLMLLSLPLEVFAYTPPGGGGSDTTTSLSEEQSSTITNEPVPGNGTSPQGGSFTGSNAMQTPMRFQNKYVIPKKNTRQVKSGISEKPAKVEKSVQAVQAR